jgi:hypothetical protein
MSTRCIQPKHLISLSAILAIAIWPSVSKAVTVSEVTWNSTTQGLNLGTTGYLNLTDNALIIQADNETDAIAAYNYAYKEVTSGVNGSPGSYEAGTPGLDSDSSVTSKPSLPSAFTDSFGITGIGVVLNDGATATPLGENDTSWSTWNGVAVNNYSVLIAFTYLGDADMSGIAQSYDVSTVLNDLDFPNSTNQTGWANGEFDYSGSVQPYDVSTVLNSLTFEADDPIVSQTNAGAALGGGAVGVPEPGTFGLAGLGLLGMLVAVGIRRRRLSMVAA